MKTQKIFLLAFALALVLCVLVSCGASQTGPGYFVFDDEPSFSEPTEFEGEIIEVNEDYNLVAFETRSLSTDGYSTRVVKVVDVANKNRVVYTRTWTKSPDSSYGDAEIILEDYPVIKVAEEYQNGTEDGVPVFKTRYEYYLINEKTEAHSISTSSDGDILKIKEINNIWLISDEDYVYWVNRNLEIMRKLPSAIADTYFRMELQNPQSYFQFEAEYCDYLYTWEFDASIASQVIIVYDPNGIACAKYTPSYNGYAPSVFVLNNGNILVQEQQFAEDGKDYDYEFPMGTETKKIDLVTKVIDYKTGAVTEIDFNCIISNLESYYSGSENALRYDSGFSLTLAEGDYNQAYLIPYGDGKIGRVTEYAVLNNDLEIQYVLPNLYLAEFGTYYIQNPGEDGYFALVRIDGEMAACKFDWSGKIILRAPTNVNGITNDCYVTESGVYDFDGKLIFDIDNADFADADLEVYGDCVYLIVENNLKLGNWQWSYAYDWDYSTSTLEGFIKSGLVPCHDCGAIVSMDAINEYAELSCHECGCYIGCYNDCKEIYKLNVKSKKLELISDGIELDAEPITADGAYGVLNQKKQTFTIYNAEGEVVLVTRMDKNVVDTYNLAGAFIVEVEVGGEYKSYIFTYGDKTFGYR